MRLDRGMYTVPIWWGLLLTGVYVLTSPTQRLSHAVPHAAETTAAVVMFVSALTCLTGTRIHNLAVAYRLELAGLVGIVAVLGWLAVVGDYSPWQQFTLAGGLGALVQIGSIRMGARLALELYRHRPVKPGGSNARRGARITESHPRERGVDARPHGRAGR